MLSKGGSILFLIIGLLATAFAAQNEAEEYQVKAAFIYNFTKFVEWEDNSMNASSVFNIGVLGDSPIIKPLQKLASSKKINNKKINVIKYNTISDIRVCHILFIPQNISPDILKSLESMPVKNSLIITERSGELENGSAINFLMVNNKIKFEVNLNSLNRSNIKASSQLLKLATNIKN